MTNLTRTTAGATTLPAPYVEAVGPLGAAIRTLHRGGTVIPHDALRDAAKRQLAALAQVAAPSTERVMLAWLTRLAPAVVNAPVDASEILRKAEAIWDLCRDLPIGVWTDESRRAWCRSQPAGRFWPTPGELHAHLDGFAAIMRADKRGCEAILRADQDTFARDVVKPGLEEREEIVAAFRGKLAAANAAASEEQRAQPVATPSHLRKDQLLASYRRLAAAPVTSLLAQTRLRMLGENLP